MRLIKNQLPVQRLIGVANWRHGNSLHTEKTAPWRGFLFCGLQGNAGGAIPARVEQSQCGDMSLGVVVMQVTDLTLQQAVRYLLLGQRLGILTLAGTGQTPEPAIEQHRNQMGLTQANTAANSTNRRVNSCGWSW